MPDGDSSTIGGDFGSTVSRYCDQREIVDAPALERDRALHARRLDRDARARGEHGLAREHLAARRRRRRRCGAPGGCAGLAGRRRRLPGGRRCRRGRRRCGCCCACCCCCCLLALLLHLRHADEDTASRSARSPTARWRGWCSSGRSCRALQRADRRRRCLRRLVSAAPANSAIMRLERQRQARRAVRSARSHARCLRRARHDSRTISRSRRRTRLRSTALPTFFETVKPTRAGAVVAALARLQHECAAPGPSRPRRRRGNPPVASAAPCRMPPAAAVRRSAACARARAAPRAPCGRPWSPCGRESRDGACAPVCSVDRSVSRVGLSAGRGLGAQGCRMSGAGSVMKCAETGMSKAAGAQAWRGLYGRRRRPSQCDAARARPPELGAKPQPVNGLHAAARRAATRRQMTVRGLLPRGGLVYSSVSELDDTPCATPSPRWTLSDHAPRAMPRRTAAAQPALRRFAPVAVVVLAMAGGVRDRRAPPGLARDAGAPPHGDRRASSTRTRVAAVAAFMAVYIVVVALSIPGALFLTISGGILFGTLVGGAATVVGATIGATDHLPGGAQRLRRKPGAPRRAARLQARRRASAPTRSAICCSCGWCRRFRSSWSISRRRWSA